MIPDRRHVLYDECVKILVERRYASPDVQDAYNRILPVDDAIWLLRDIARQMHKAHLPEVSRSDLENIFIPQALKTINTRGMANVLPKDLLKNIEERSQLLVERGINDKGQPVMAFSHLTFQEYLASVSLKELIGQFGAATVNDKLLSCYIADHEWWEEVALLYAAQLEGPQRQNFLQRILPF